MNESAYEWAVVSLTLAGWRAMLAHQNARRDIIRAICPNLNVDGNLEKHVVDLVTASETECEIVPFSPARALSA